MSEQLFGRLEGLSDEELVWEPAAKVLTVRRRPDGSTGTDAHGLPPDARVQPPRTLAWSIDHLGAGTLVRADWLVGSHARWVHKELLEHAAEIWYVRDLYAASR